MDGRGSVGVERTVVGVSEPGTAALLNTPAGHSRRVGGCVGVGVELGEGRGSGSDTSSSVGHMGEDYHKEWKCYVKKNYWLKEELRIE